MFAYKNDEDESNFNFVDNKQRAKPQYKRSTIRGATNYHRPNQNNSNRGGFKNQGNRPLFRGRGATRGRGGYRRTYRDDIVRDPSIPIKTSWELVQSIEFNQIPSAGTVVPTVTDLLDVGVVPTYNPIYDTLNLRRAKMVVPSSTPEYTATASADPTMSSFAESKTANVYATEAVISLLMAATSTVQSWDLLVRKTEDGLFIDKRPDSKVNTTIVHETGSDNLPTEADNMNSAEALSNEATDLAHAFSTQVFETAGAKALEKPAPEGVAPALYRYRKFDIDGISLLVRAVVHGVNAADDEYILARMVNEFDSKVAVSTVDWRSKMDSQSGAVLAGEIKNNAARMVRVAAEAFLAGADTIKLGYISRIQTRDPLKHEILKVESYTPRMFVQLLNYTVRSLWTSLKFLLEELLDLENGKYVLLRDPSLPQLKIFKVPDTAFDSTTGQFSAEVDSA